MTRTLRSGRLGVRRPSVREQPIAATPITPFCTPSIASDIAGPFP